MKNKLTIKKHSSIIQTNVKNLTLTQRKIINFLIHVAQKSDDKEIFKTNVSELKKLCNIKANQNFDLKEQLRKLADIKIEFNFLNKDKKNVWKIMALISEIQVIDGYIDFAFSPSMRNEILNPRIYTPLKIMLIASLKNKYSIVLYELLRDYKNSPNGLPKLTIDDFRSLLGIEDDKYVRFYDLKKKILNPAVNEINKKSDIVCSYLLFKEAGNRYSHIKFNIESVQKPEEIKLINSSGIVENKNQLKMRLDENSLKISKEFSVPNELMAEWSDKIGSEKIDEVYEYTKAKKPKNPAGYMRSIIESGSDLSGISQISKEEKINKMKAAAQGCMMKHVTEQKHCGKTYEDALDPKTNCFYCYFKTNGTLQRTQKTDEEFLQEQEEKNINECIDRLKEKNLIDEYTERVRQDPTKAAALNFLARNPNTYLNILNSYIYEEWKTDQKND